jgi:CRP-like cAMP-binding protein
VVDEFGFDRIEREECPQAAHLLYKVIASRHQKRSTILITNVDFDAWAQYLGDAPLAMAMLDRLVDGRGDPQDQGTLLSSQPTRRTHLIIDRLPSHRATVTANRALPGVQPRRGVAAKGAFAFGAFPIPLVPGQKYATGVEVLRQGEIATEVWIIDDGVVKLVYCDEDGRDLIVGIRLKDWILGSASVILDRPSPVAAFTMTSCYLQRLDGATFLDMVSGTSTLSSWLHRMHSQEVLDQLLSITQASALSARRRLERVLAQLIESLGDSVQGGEIRVTLPFSHRDLASLVRTTPEHLSRLLRQLIDEGLIRRKKGWIIVTDLGKLKISSPSSSLSKIDIYQDRR